MARKAASDRDHPAAGFGAEDAGSLMSGLLADEEAFDRRALLRLGAWGAVSVGAVVVAVLVNHSSVKWRQDQLAALDLQRQSQQIQSVARESQNEARRLASAIDTLNDDRDRLYSRMTAVEQGLGSVTGSISRQSAAAVSPSAAMVPPPVPSPAPAVAATVTSDVADKPAIKPAPPAVATVAVDDPARVSAATPTAPLPAPKSTETPPASVAVAAPAAPEATSPVTAAASPVEEPAAAEPATAPSPVKRTEFGVDVGGANSVAGLRALWRNLNRSKSGAALATLEPIIVVKEGAARQPGLQLRLVAGPFTDAATAARVCAIMIENRRSCETTEFDGQRLAMKAGDTPAATAAVDKPGVAKPVVHRRVLTKRIAADQPAAKPEAASPAPLFGRH